MERPSLSGVSAAELLLALSSPRPEVKGSVAGPRTGSAAALQAAGWEGPSLGMSHSSCSAVNVGVGVGGTSLLSEPSVGGKSLLSEPVIGGGESIEINNSCHLEPEFGSLLANLCYLNSWPHAAHTHALPYAGSLLPHLLGVGRRDPAPAVNLI